VSCVPPPLRVRHQGEIHAALSGRTALVPTASEAHHRLMSAGSEIERIVAHPLEGERRLTRFIVTYADGTRITVEGRSRTPASWRRNTAW